MNHPWTQNQPKQARSNDLPPLLPVNGHNTRTEPNTELKASNYVRLRLLRTDCRPEPERDRVEIPAIWFWPNKYMTIEGSESVSEERAKEYDRIQLARSNEVIFSLSRSRPMIIQAGVGGAKETAWHRLRQ